MAVRLGVWDVEVIKRGLTAKKFIEWMAYAELEPFDETRADYRAASIAQIIANTNRAKDQKPYTLDDVLLKFNDDAPKQKKQHWKEQAAIMSLYARAHAELVKEGVVVKDKE